MRHSASTAVRRALLTLIMAYVTLSALEADIPREYLIEALDDDGDGVEDAGTAVLDAASEKVDGYLAGRYTVPFASPYPSLVKRAAYVFAAESIYRRRGIPDEKNPWAKEAGKLMAKLELISQGKLSLDIAAAPGRSSGDVIGEASKTYSEGRTSV